MLPLRLSWFNSFCLRLFDFWYSWMFFREASQWYSGILGKALFGKLNITTFWFRLLTKFIPSHIVTLRPNHMGLFSNPLMYTVNHANTHTLIYTQCTHKTVNSASDCKGRHPRWTLLRFWASLTCLLSHWWKENTQNIHLGVYLRSDFFLKCMQKKCIFNYILPHLHI